MFYVDLLHFISSMTLKHQMQHFWGGWDWEGGGGGGEIFEFYDSKDTGG